MGSFAWRNGAFCKTGKHPLKLSRWYSISYVFLSYFAYLRPRKSLLANTRLFFGVYQETEAKKSKTDYNL